MNDEQEEREGRRIGAERSSPAGRGRGPLLRGAVAAWTRRPSPDRAGASAPQERRGQPVAGGGGRGGVEQQPSREGGRGRGCWTVFLDKNLGLGGIREKVEMRGFDQLRNCEQ